jgi:hypothetical protein
MMSWVVVDGGIRGPRICPEAPIEAAARTTDAATAPWRNLRREMRGALTGGGRLGGGEADRWVEAGGVEFVDVLGFFSSMDNSSVSQE